MQMGEVMESEASIWHAARLQPSAAVSLWWWPCPWPDTYLFLCWSLSLSCSSRVLVKAVFWERVCVHRTCKRWTLLLTADWIPRHRSGLNLLRGSQKVLFIKMFRVKFYLVSGPEISTITKLWTKLQNWPVYVESIVKQGIYWYLTEITFLRERLSGRNIP